MNVNIGIDTSCYTTSIVAIDDMKKILFEDRIVLPVKKGTFGLRQSDAFFHHVKNMPLLLDKCLNSVDRQSIRTVTVSDKPRQIEGSYMPVFTAGLNMAQLISSSLNCKLYTLSHQENHLYAVAHEVPLPKSFIGVHISGGTSEILKVTYDRGMTIDIIGHTLDLSFGKLIDRVGVYMGLDFPAGRVLDANRNSSEGIYQLKLSVKSTDFNISGFENKLKAYYDQEQNLVKVANTLFYYIGETLVKVLKTAQEEEGVSTIVVSGGVSANSYLRECLEGVFGDQIIFAKPTYATDHALGNAYYGSLQND